MYSSFVKTQLWVIVGRVGKMHKKNIEEAIEFDVTVLIVYVCVYVYGAIYAFGVLQRREAEYGAIFPNFLVF